MKNLIQFIKVFAINIALAVVLVVLISFVTLYIIDNYTKHGEAISVPDFNGMNLEEVKETCEKHLLRYEIVDSVYSNRVEKGSVVEQSPKKEFKVKENRTIFLTINALYPERVKMPNVVGVSLRQATALLETYGLKPGKLKYMPDFATNYVKKQFYKGEEINEGTFIEKWSHIDLVVGKQSHEKGIIPNVIGLKLSEAEQVLTENGFNIGLIICDDDIQNFEDTLNARIKTQSPRHHKKIEVSLGKAVEVHLTLDTIEVTTADTLQNINKNEG